MEERATSPQHNHHLILDQINSKLASSKVTNLPGHSIHKLMFGMKITNEGTSIMCPYIFIILKTNY